MEGRLAHIAYVSPEIKAVRHKAMPGLFDLFKRATCDEPRRGVISALREATRPSSRAEFSNELLEPTIEGRIRIADFFANEAGKLSFELRVSMERNYLFDYRCARGIAEDGKDRFGCGTVAKDLVGSILRLRDRISVGQNFVRYKTLVGFETVMAKDWGNEDRDFAKVEQFRSSEAER